MTAKIPFTQATVRRAIAAARAEGLHVLCIRPDGSVVVGENPIPIGDILPPAPASVDQAEYERWVGSFAK